MNKLRGLLEDNFVKTKMQALYEMTKLNRQVGAEKKDKLMKEKENRKIEELE